MMKKIFTILLSFGLVLGFSMGLTGQAEAKTKIVKYDNCKALNKVYNGGVARASNVKNKGGKTKFKPFVSSELYKVNSSLDRDKDGIACER